MDHLWVSYGAEMAQCPMFVTGQVWRSSHFVLRIGCRVPFLVDFLLHPWGGGVGTLQRSYVRGQFSEWILILGAIPICNILFGVLPSVLRDFKLFFTKSLINFFNAHSIMLNLQEFSSHFGICFECIPSEKNHS